MRLLLKIRFALRHPIKIIKKINKRIRSYNISEKDLFLKTKLKIETIVEAGASDGVDTLELINYFPEAKIYALEPVKDQFMHLKKKFKDIDNVFLIKDNSELDLYTTSELVESEQDSDEDGEDD